MAHARGWSFRWARPVALAAAVGLLTAYWWAGTGWFLPRFRQAALERRATQDTLRQMYYWQREVTGMEKQKRAARTPAEEEEQLRDKGLVKPGEVHLIVPQSRPDR